VNAPPEVRAIAADAPVYQWQTTQPWRDLATRPHRDEDDARAFLYRQAARGITEKFMADVMKRMSIHTTDEVDGHVTRFACVALRHDQLVDLLYRAYRAGQSDAMQRTAQLEHLR
jgi:hypothetical protein